MPTDLLVAFPLYGSGGGTTVPVKAADNGDGTYSLAISSDLTLDPTNLATSAKQDTLAALVATAAKQDALKAVIGAADDAAWSGSGNGTVISLLKAIALNTTPTP